MYRLIMSWVIASMLIAVTAVTGKTAEVTSLISQGAALDAAAVEAASESVLWSFGATSDDGEVPLASVIADKKGNLYGTTINGGANDDFGTVFELSPPTGKQTQWSESVLWSFGAYPDGANPEAGLIADKDGNLYGTTQTGGGNCRSFGGCGTVFELSPPSGKQTQWTESVLWRFCATSTDGEGPYASLITDKRGNLYSTTQLGGKCLFCGTVFELSPPSGKQTQWTENVLWYFNIADGMEPLGALIADNQGNLYGTTSLGGTNGDGTVFELSPPSREQTQWSERVLWNFDATSNDGILPQASLIADNQDNLYGTTEAGGTNSGGTVFELSAPSGKQKQWTESVLWNFGADGDDGQNPYAGLLADKRGNLYGTTLGGGANGGGTSFELSQPSDKRIPWTESILWNFGANGDDGQNPLAALIFERGNFYGTTLAGGANGGGTIFELTLP